MSYRVRQFPPHSAQVLDGIEVAVIVVVVARHAIVNSEAALDLGDAARALGLAACTATPVFALGTLACVLCVYVPHDGFSDGEVRAIGALAQEIGLEIARSEQRAVNAMPISSRTALAAAC